MSIDKHSTGLPEIDVHRRTTKVNLGMTIGLAIFFVIVVIAIIWMARQHG